MLVPVGLVCFGDLNTQSQPRAISLDVGKHLIAGLASAPTPPSSQHPEPGQSEVGNAVSRQVSLGMHPILFSQPKPKVLWLIGWTLTCKARFFKPVPGPSHTLWSRTNYLCCLCLRRFLIYFKLLWRSQGQGRKDTAPGLFIMTQRYRILLTSVRCISIPPH